MTMQFTTAVNILAYKLHVSSLYDYAVYHSSEYFGL